MSIESVPSRHWTDDELIDHIYGLRPETDHLNACAACHHRLAEMESRRAISISSTADVSHEFLAAQRRSIYQRLSEPLRWWQRIHFRRLASALAMGSVLAAGLVYYEHAQMRNQPVEELSDAQLADDVSSMAQNSEPSPTAPLQALFEE